jgi:hypothetical protein
MTSNVEGGLTMIRRGTQQAVWAVGMLALAACSPTISGQVKDDASVTGQTQKLEAAGANYHGPGLYHRDPQVCE